MQLHFMSSQVPMEDQFLVFWYQLSSHENRVKLFSKGQINPRWKYYTGLAGFLDFWKETWKNVFQYSKLRLSPKISQSKYALRPQPGHSLGQGRNLNLS